MKKPLKIIFIIALFYFLFALLFTYPLITKISTHGFGIDEDAPYHIWHSWWLKFSLFDLNQNPLFTDYIFHPQKIPLVFDANAFVFSTLTVPLQFITGNVILSSNIIFLLSFVLSGLSMYLLAHYVLSQNISGTVPKMFKGTVPLEDSRMLAAFIAGAIFAFSPYTLAQAIDGHINLTSTWIIPLYTLFLLKALRSFHPSGGKYPILTGFFATLQLYNDFTYTAFMIILTILIFAYYVFVHQTTTTIIRIIKVATVLGLVSGILSIPILLPAYKLTRMGFRPGSPLWVQNEWSADLLAFFRPNDRTTFLKPFIYTPPRGTIEGTVYLGWTVVLLSAITTFRWFFSRIRNWKLEIRNLDLGLWTLLAATFFILSLGPSLHIGGQWKFNLFGLQNIPIPLPWIFIHKIPFVGETQEPTRVNPFLMMALAVLVAIGTRQLVNWLARQPGRTGLAVLLTGCLAGFIIIEYLPLPFPTTNLQVPEIYYQIRKDPSDFAVLNLPLGLNSGNVALGPSPIGSLQFYQTAHQKPAFRATVARLPTWAFDYYRNIPLIKYFLNPGSSPDKDDLNKEKVGQVFRDQLRIKYIVLHKDKYEEAKFPLGDTEKLIETVLEAEKVYEKERVTAYKLW